MAPTVLQHDFLHYDPPAKMRGSVVVTNPPYNQLDAFITRGLELLDSGMLAAAVLLTRIDATMAKRRISALNRAAILWQCNWRTIWIPGTKTGPRWVNVWCCWRADSPGPPTIQFLRRPGGIGDLFENAQRRRRT
jgi:hypothetical protein